MPTIEQALDFAITAIDKGETLKGRDVLSWVLQQDPENAIALLWLPACLSAEHQKAACYRKLSQINITLQT
jgi:hypothetical protein